MATTSLLAVSRLLKEDTIARMGGALRIPAPVSARRILALAPFSVLPAWELVSGEGIAKDEKLNVWHCGHLEDVLPLDSGRALVASQTGGVWLVFTDGRTPAVPLSNFWPDVDMHCLTSGPKGARHVYAAGRAGALYETETDSFAAVAGFERLNSLRAIATKLGQPASLRRVLEQDRDAALFAWRKIPLKSSSGVALTAGVFQVLVVPGVHPGKLVLATSEGIYWSDIADVPANFRFSQAAAVTGQCLAVALGKPPGQANLVVCSPTGSSSTPESNGIYVGRWDASGHLALTRAALGRDIDPKQWSYAVVASCEADRSRLYGMVAATGQATLSLRRAFLDAGMPVPPARELTQLATAVGSASPVSLLSTINQASPPTSNDDIYAVLFSRDGGLSWAPTGPNGLVAESVRFPVKPDGTRRLPGTTQFGYNLTLAVSNVDPETMAIGVKAGPWIGRNKPTEFEWEEHGDEASLTGASPHIHGDCHGMHFDSRDPSGRTLWMCSDGGLVHTTNLGASFFSLTNHFLPNLQFQSDPLRFEAAPGAAGASLDTPGLVAGPLRDNGVVFSSETRGSQGPWRRQTIADDGLMGIFLETDLLLFWNNDDATARVAKWDGTKFLSEAKVKVNKPSPTLPTGTAFSSPFVEPVLHPVFRRQATHQRMIAVAAYNASGAFQDVWGLFVDNDGGNPGWEFLASVPLDPGDTITAVASNDGTTVLVGSLKGNIYSLDVATGNVTAMPLDPSVPGFLGKIYQFAFLNGGSRIVRYQSTLLRFDSASQVWTQVPGVGLPRGEGGFYFLAVDSGRSPEILYVATDYGVHASWDVGGNWLPVSQGLPAHCHPSTLRTVSWADGSRHLYLFTYGRAAWHARLSN